MQILIHSILSNENIMGETHFHQFINKLTQLFIFEDLCNESLSKYI